jgi:hypothetical protein
VKSALNISPDLPVPAILDPGKCHPRIRRDGNRTEVGKLQANEKRIILDGILASGEKKQAAFLEPMRQKRMNLKQFVATIISQLKGRSSGEDLKSSWAETVESYAAVPDVYKGFFEAYRTGGRDFPYAVLTPNFEGFLNPSTEKMICEMGGEICVLERSGNSFRAKSYPLEEISYLEAGTVLLDSYIKITGATREGASASSMLRFNAASDFRMEPLLEKIRRGSDPARSGERGAEPAVFDSWMNRDFKFMNYGRRSALEGDAVLQAILQPEIRERVLKLPGWTFFRRLAPTMACILTGRELIMIREDNNRIAGERYGGIWHFIPLHKIEKLSLLPKDGKVLVLSVHLPRTDRLDFVFEPSAKHELDRLLEDVRQ